MNKNKVLKEVNKIKAALQTLDNCSSQLKEWFDDDETFPDIESEISSINHTAHALTKYVANIEKIVRSHNV